MSIKRHGPEYLERLLSRRKGQRKLLKHAFLTAARIIEQGGTVAFEWPKPSLGWLMPELLDFTIRNRMCEAICAGCYFGVTGEDGQPMKKEGRVITHNPRLARSLNACGCKHGPDFKHSQVQGKYTAKTAFYPIPMCNHQLAVPVKDMVACAFHDVCAMRRIMCP